MTRTVRPLTAREATALGFLSAAAVIGPHAAGVLAADPMIEGTVVQVTTVPHPPVPRMCLAWPEQPCPDPVPASTVVVIVRTDGTVVRREEPASVAAGCTTGATVRFDTGCRDGAR